MTKDELIAKVAQDAGLTKRATTLAIDSLIETIVQRAARDEDTVVSGLGCFGKRRREARAGRNPQTGERLIIEAKSSLGFKASKRANDRIPV